MHPQLCYSPCATLLHLQLRASLSRTLQCRPCITSLPMCRSSARLQLRAFEERVRREDAVVEACVKAAEAASQLGGTRACESLTTLLMLERLCSHLPFLLLQDCSFTCVRCCARNRMWLCKLLVRLLAGWWLQCYCSSCCTWGCLQMCVRVSGNLLEGGYKSRLVRGS